MAKALWRLVTSRRVSEAGERWSSVGSGQSSWVQPRLELCVAPAELGFDVMLQFLDAGQVLPARLPADPHVDGDVGEGGNMCQAERRGEVSPLVGARRAGLRRTPLCRGLRPPQRPPGRGSVRSLGAEVLETERGPDSFQGRPWRDDNGLGPCELDAGARTGGPLRTRSLGLRLARPKRLGDLGRGHRARRCGHASTPWPRSGAEVTHSQAVGPGSSFHRRRVR
jgi:hypothetical protein